MRRVMTVLGVMAVLALTASAAQADIYCSGNNQGNAGDTGPANGPYATTGGAVWIDTGGGPVAVDQDLNMEFMYSSSSPTGPFADLVPSNPPPSGNLAPLERRFGGWGSLCA